MCKASGARCARVAKKATTCSFSDSALAGCNLSLFHPLICAIGTKRPTAPSPAALCRSALIGSLARSLSRFLRYAPFRPSPPAPLRPRATLRLDSIPLLPGAVELSARPALKKNLGRPSFSPASALCMALRIRTRQRG